MEKPELQDWVPDLEAEDIAEAFATLPGVSKETIVLDVICDETGLIWSSPNPQN